MPLPRTIEIDGRRYAWRELVALRFPQPRRAERRRIGLRLRLLRQVPKQFIGRHQSPPAKPSSPENHTAPAVGYISRQKNHTL